MVLAIGKHHKSTGTTKGGQNLLTRERHRREDTEDTLCKLDAGATAIK